VQGLEEEGEGSKRNGALLERKIGLSVETIGEISGIDETTQGREGVARSIPAQEGGDLEGDKSEGGSLRGTGRLMRYDRVLIYCQLG
jgi:hypothetical protein